MFTTYSNLLFKVFNSKATWVTVALAVTIISVLMMMWFIQHRRKGRDRHWNDENDEEKEEYQECILNRIKPTIEKPESMNADERNPEESITKACQVEVLYKQ